MEIAALAAHLDSGHWKSQFDAAALAEGRKLARARKVSAVKATQLDSGDAELAAHVTTKDGALHHPTIAFWQGADTIQLDTTCDCDVATCCPHAAAAIEYLLKATPERLATAFGQTPQAEKMTGGKTLAAPISSRRELATDNTPTFLLRVQPRPQEDQFSWLPDIVAQAYAVYGTSQLPLDPSGNLRPLQAEGQTLHRSRPVEMKALQALYALDLHPIEGGLWTVDTKEWPHPEFFWQRFRHEAVPALEATGWEVRFAPDVGMEPLTFKTDAWRAEIVDEGKGWFHLSAGFEIDGEQFELQPILAALVANNFLDATEGLPDGQEFLIFLPDGRGLALPVGRFRHILTNLGQLVGFPFPEGPIRIGKLDAALLTGEEGADENLEAQTPPEVKKLARRIASFQEIERGPTPEGLQATLRDYQLDGFHWMQFLARYSLHGILADDMGLGKTLQALAHLLAEKTSGQNQGRPSLVVAPTSVVLNWQREAKKFAPRLNVLVLQGPRRKKYFPTIPHADLVLTSYALLPRDLDALAEHHFHILALDEAQYIKNRGAQVSAAVRGLHANHRLCLSGTPVENHLGELWSLMDFLMPGFLGDQDTFNTTYRTPIEKSGDGEKADALARRVGPLILRRTKHDVAKELPPKTEITHTIQLEGDQQDLYETIRSTMDKQVRQALAIRGAEAQVVFLDALLKLRQICCHPQLLPGDHEGASSAKFRYLVDLLATLRDEGHRVLLFSQFTSMLDIIEAHLTDVECPYLKLTGATKNRQDLVEAWQGGEGEVFLISLKAGGTGLTLTGADTVIHYDPWWNPAAENQATDRAYRIGQDKPVFVHKLICQDTVEERIQQMQGKKDDLATDLLSGAAQGLTLTPDTMAELLA